MENSDILHGKLIPIFYAACKIFENFHIDETHEKLLFQFF